MHKIRELGSLPQVVQQYRETPATELMKLLDKTNKRLARYSHVNKKALDQYVSFTTQREEYMKRKQDIDLAAAKIEELRGALDAQKDEAIERTFKGVARAFEDVFAELVPGGKGILAMQRTKDTGEAQEEQTDRISQYTGVAIKVDFLGTGEVQHMRQLSGGQKSLVALALIFAIQRCDPAPFYLFDEIDSALDTQHREAVAKMIAQQSEKAQFITSTFREELVKHAKKWYGIAFKNKISTMQAITEKKALSIIRAFEVAAPHMEATVAVEEVPADDHMEEVPFGD